MRFHCDVRPAVGGRSLSQALVSRPTCTIISPAPTEAQLGQGCGRQFRFILSTQNRGIILILPVLVTPWTLSPSASDFLALHLPHTPTSMSTPYSVLVSRPYGGPRPWATTQRDRPYRSHRTDQSRAANSVAVIVAGMFFLCSPQSQDVASSHSVTPQSIRGQLQGQSSIQPPRADTRQILGVAQSRNAATHFGFTSLPSHSQGSKHEPLGQVEKGLGPIWPRFQHSRADISHRIITNQV